MINRRNWVLLGCGNAVWVCTAQAGGTEATMALGVQHEPAGRALRSRQHAQRIDALRQVELPDAWYPAQGATLTERFQATFRAMPAGPGQPASVAELMARYDNQGQPVVHAVWFNRPLRCAACKAAGADGFRTLISVRLGLSLTVTAEEMHLVLEHGASFPEAKLALLDRLFEAPQARP